MELFAGVQVGRTLSRVQQVFTWSYVEDIKPFKPPLSDSEFHSYLNGQGQLTRPEELRLRIYHGGVEPSLRKVCPPRLLLTSSRSGRGSEVVGVE